MRRIRTGLLALGLVVGVIVAASGPAVGAPVNRQALTYDANCDGTTVTFSTVHHVNPRADLIAAVPTVGGGSAKLVWIDAYLPGTNTLVFSGSTGYPRPAETTCTGTVTEDGFTFDFVIGVVLHGH